MVVKKHEIEAALYQEHQDISEGRLKEDNPLDESEDFRILCEACRRGDSKVCHEKLEEGVNINARDRFDYTPLILASLCGHYEVVRFLLESGALCERDTFQGERCLYNALNDRIRNLLLAYDYSKSRDPLQPLAGHFTSLLSRPTPPTSDITLVTETKSFDLHKFVLSARSPYFAKKLNAAPDTSSWKASSSIPTRAFEIAILGLYFGEVSAELGDSDEDREILAGIEKLGKQMEIDLIVDAILENNRRVARQRRTEEVNRGRSQVQEWFEKNVLGNAIHVASDKVDDIKWDGKNQIFADVLLCAEDEPGSDTTRCSIQELGAETARETNGRDEVVATSEPNISSGCEPPFSDAMKPMSTLFPVHRAMLIRSDYFRAMFTSPFKEAQPTPHLPVVRVDCRPDVLRVVLMHLYAEHTSFPLEMAIEVLFIADQLFIEPLKAKAAMVISTLGNGDSSVVESTNPRGQVDNSEEVVDIYDVIRAGWDTRMPRLEEFGARYIAYRLERYVDTEDFKEIVKESAARIQGRQETDTVEIVDDIRYYLSDRFRLRFEDAGIDEMEDRAAAYAQAQVDKRENAAATENGNKEVEPSISSEDVQGVSGVDRRGILEQQGRGDQSHIDHDHTKDSGDAAARMRTLDGEEIGDEFAQDAMNYHILLNKIDKLLDELKLDA